MSRLSSLSRLLLLVVIPAVVMAVVQPAAAVLHSPHWIRDIATVDEARDVALSGDYALVADGAAGLVSINLLDIASAGVVDAVPTGPGAESVDVAGDHAFVVDGVDALHIVSISDPTSMSEVGSISGLSGAAAVAVQGSYAFIVRPGVLSVVNVFDPANPSAAGSVALPASAGSGGGVAVIGSYAMVAQDDLHVIDISNPYAPSVVTSLHYYGNAVDVALAFTPSGLLAYVAVMDDPVEHGLGIVDLSNPAAPAAAGFVTLDACELLQPCGATSVGEAGEYAVVAEPYGALRVVDASDPNNPAVVAGVGLPADLSAVNVSGDVAFVASPNGLIIVDISARTGFDIVDDSFHGELTEDICIAGDYAYVANRYDGLDVLSITDPASAAVVGTVDTPHRANGVTVAGSYAYVADGTSGMQVIDVSNPTAPLIAGSVDTPNGPGNEFAWSVAVAGTHAYIANATQGVQIADVADPTNPVLVGSLPTPGWAFDIVTAGDLACVTDLQNGLHVVDLSAPTAPTILATVPIADGRSVAYYNGYAYLACGAAGLKVVDVSDPAAPQLVGSASTPGYAQHALRYGTNAYLADGFAGLQIFDVTDPTSPELTASIETPGYSYAVAVSGTHAVIADGERTLVADLTAEALTAVRPGRPGDIGMTLGQNVPNPFNPVTRIDFRLDSPARVLLRVYDVSGRVVRTLVDGEFGAGPHIARWSGVDDAGRPAASGVYFYRLTANGRSLDRKAVLLK